MVKEFEQQHEQDLAILLDPWLPRTKITPEQRDVLEEAIKFAATLCFETCRHPGRRLLLGWTGATPGVRQGPASVKLLHEFLEQLATLRSSSEGDLSALLDVIPPSTLRESFLIVVSTRPINLMEEAERSSSALGLVTPRAARPGDAPRCLEGRPGRPDPIRSNRRNARNRGVGSRRMRMSRRGSRHRPPSNS